MYIITGVTYIEKSRSLSTEPCGTPDSNETVFVSHHEQPHSGNNWT